MRLTFTILTKRLKLRDFTQDDWISVHNYASDPETVRYVGWGPNTKGDSKDFIQRTIASQKQEPRTIYSLAVTLKEENILIGGCGISISDPQNCEGSIYYIFSRDFWGQGYATEAARALLDFGFKELSLHRISAWCDVENTASSHVMEKIGMKREGRLRDYRMQGGKWRDSFLYSILDYEWSSTKADKTSEL